MYYPTHFIKIELYDQNLSYSYTSSFLKMYKVVKVVLFLERITLMKENFYKQRIDFY